MAEDRTPLSPRQLRHLLLVNVLVGVQALIMLASSLAGALPLVFIPFAVLLLLGAVVSYQWEVRKVRRHRSTPFAEDP